MRTAFIVLILFNMVLVAWFLVRDGDSGTVAASDEGLPAASPEIRIIADVPPVAEGPGAGAQVGGAVAGTALGAPGVPEGFPSEGAGPVEVAAATTAGETVACELLGPFIEARFGDAVLGRVRDQGYAAEILSREVKGTSDYWVYYPPLPTRKEALRQLKELQARNIDSYVITQGELVNGISLGLFTQKASAEGLVARMAEFGYRVAVQEVSRSHREFWVSLVYPEGAPPGGELWVRLMADFPLMQRRETSCA